MQALNLNLTEAARVAIDRFMEDLDYDESVPCLTRERTLACGQYPPGDYWTVGAYHPDRIRFFEQLRANTGMEFFFKCDGVVLLLWQPCLASTLQGRTLDYVCQRYRVI